VISKSEIRHSAVRLVYLPILIAAEPIKIQTTPDSDKIGLLPERFSARDMASLPYPNGRKEMLINFLTPLFSLP
jgi:hypothetical protein